LREKIKLNIEMKKHIFASLPEDQRPTVEVTFEALKSCREQARPLMGDVSEFLIAAIKKEKRILFEGAQGTLLDIDFGTYPYATASNTTIGGVLTGLGIGSKYLGTVTGIVKAYQTRVGTGPFPTELHNSLGEEIRKWGHEFGSTTGRPRRCGWLDLVLLKYSVRINGVDDIALMKMDVLDNLKEVKICTGYKLNGQVLDTLPLSSAQFTKVEPIYETSPGWSKPIGNCKSFSELDPNARAYLKKIEEVVGVKISLLSTGAERDETIVIR
jgi:adenylosuccinate synthase